MELLNGFFASVFTAKASPQQSQALEARETVWRKEELPFVKEDWVRDHIEKLDTHKLKGPDRMWPQMVRELPDAIAKPFSIIFERSWRTEEVPEDWRKDNVTPVFKKAKKENLGNYRSVNLTSVPGKVMEQLIRDVISTHVKENGFHHGFIKR